jgi:thiosulfate/3-mercaptopyruvate sulfurtransferase
MPAAAPPSPLISVEELAAALDAAPTPGEAAANGAAPRWRLLDVRWQLGNPATHADYLEAHIPGAVWVDLDAELAAPPSPALGRHPLPSREALQRAARRWGLRASDRVVIYDAVGSQAAARAWWLLSNAGFATVQVLDGAFQAWRARGLPVESGAAVPEPGDVALSGEDRLVAIGLEEAAAFAGRGGLLLDARAKERYLGLTEPVDPRAGHIPGAVSAPTGENTDAQGRFLPPAALRARFEALGARAGRPIAAYCGSGVTAAHEVLALRLAGFEAALYPGSWSQWSHTDRPAEAGEGSSPAGQDEVADAVCSEARHRPTSRPDRAADGSRGALATSLPT